ncbi:MAG: transcriptional regulator [Candidatus Electrothrix sp. MAN1_4]|nr:transcriptional regulator [Candidatus Electrothrix sp. MAN1_4]
MRTLTLAISSREEMNRRFLQAFEGKSQGSLVTFESPSLLFTLLTADRWDLLRMMTGAGSMTIRDAAQRLQKDLKEVDADMQALFNVGIVQKDDSGDFAFPFEAVHVDFMLQAA